jgi:hypothetical protein
MMAKAEFKYIHSIPMASERQMQNLVTEIGRLAEKLHEKQPGLVHNVLYTEAEGKGKKPFEYLLELSSKYEGRGADAAKTAQRVSQLHEQFVKAVSKLKSFQNLVH